MMYIMADYMKNHFDSQSFIWQSDKISYGFFQSKVTMADYTSAL